MDGDGIFITFVFFVIIAIPGAIILDGCEAKEKAEAEKKAALIQSATKPSATSKPTTRPVVMEPREVGPNLRYFSTDGWPENFAAWIEKNPTKRVSRPPVFQPHWQNSTVGEYLVVTEDVPAEPTVE